MKYFDWQAVYIDKSKTLEDWRKDKYVLPRFIKVTYESEAKARTLIEFQELANELKPIAEKYTGRKSLWSGKILLRSDCYPYKDWNCDIWLEKDSPKHVLLHEMIHSCSASYYSKEIYLNNRYKEELAVQYLCQEMSQSEGIKIIAGGYDKGVELLRKIKRSLNLNISDLEFAQDLLNQPISKRWEYLEELTVRAATVEEYLKVLKQIEVLKKWKVRKKER